MKIGLVVFTANTRGDNQKCPKDSIRAIARHAEADGFDSIWLADHLLIETPQPTRGIWELSGFENHVARIESSPDTPAFEELWRLTRFGTIGDGDSEKAVRPLLGKRREPAKITGTSG